MVTGGAGFIGSHIATELVEQGARVRILDNFATGTPANLDHIRDEIELIEGDLRNEEDVRSAVQGVELVFHQGALASVPRSIDDPKSTFDVNVTGTLNVLVAARDSGVRRNGSHSLVVVMVIALIGFVDQRHANLWLGIAIGALSHLWRDLGTGTVPLLWPVMDVVWDVSYRRYLAIILGAGIALIGSGMLLSFHEKAYRSQK